MPPSMGVSSTIMVYTLPRALYARCCAAGSAAHHQHLCGEGLGMAMQRA